MEAIEIYQKIIELAKDQDFNEFQTANNFAMDKLRSAYYAKQEVAGSKYGSLSAGIACNSLATPYDPEARAAAIVRQVVREELDKTPDQTEAKEAA